MNQGGMKRDRNREGAQEERHKESQLPEETETKIHGGHKLALRVGSGVGYKCHQPERAEGGP